MRGIRSTSAIAALATLASGAAADPCASSVGEVRLSTRKPVTDPEARLLSGFGIRLHPLLGQRRMHTGIDWAAARGSPVIAAAAGRVSFAGFKSQYGKTVIIEHGGGLATLYAHLRDIDVLEGDCVPSGARIGGVGSTGLTEAVAVHFEVQRGGTAVDPFKVAVVGIDQ
jgi:murein DD-endopeptidase MepM/ murein hydrolase activator NlpD